MNCLFSVLQHVSFIEELKREYALDAIPADCVMMRATAKMFDIASNIHTKKFEVRVDKKKS